jgi:uncharacterized membrane protein YgcG
VSTDTSADSTLLAGRYRLDRVLGAGGAAVVHEGCDVDTGERVAVKVYRPDGSGHPTQQHRELAALTSLRHPGLVALRGGGTEPGPDGRTYVVTDLVDGPSLARRLHTGPLSAEEVRGLAVGLADALAHVHAHGFVHRDIKPANILLEHGHTPRLADFGIARALDGTVVTATGAVAGTAAYLAPEQVRGEVVEPSVDIFALGLVLIEALTGQREYPGTMVESATARLHRRPVVPEGLPPDLAAVLAAMTDLDPAARPTAAAVVTALTGPQVAEPTPVRRRVASSAPRALAAAVLLAVLVGGIVVLLAGARGNAPAVPVPDMAAPATSAPPAPSGVPVVPDPAVPDQPGRAPVVANAAVAAALPAAAEPSPAPARPVASGAIRAPAPAPAPAPAAAPAPAPAKVAAPAPAPAPVADKGDVKPDVTADDPAENKGKGNANGQSNGNGQGQGQGNGQGNGNGNGQGNGNSGGNGNGNSGEGQGAKSED